MLGVRTKSGQSSDSEGNLCWSNLNMKLCTSLNGSLKIHTRHVGRTRDLLSS